MSLHNYKEDVLATTFMQRLDPKNRQTTEFAPVYLVAKGGLSMNLLYSLISLPENNVGDTDVR